MSAVYTPTQTTNWTHELAPLRSHAEFAVARPLRSRRRGRVGGLRGQMLLTEEGARVWIRGDSGAITFTSSSNAAECPIDPDLWPWIELEVEAVRHSMAQPFMNGRARLSLNGVRVTLDTVIHDLGTAPAGGQWPQRRLLAITAAAPRHVLVDALSDSITRLRWHQLSRLELDLYLEFTQRETS